MSSFGQSFAACFLILVILTPCKGWEWSYSSSSGGGAEASANAGGNPSWSQSGQSSGFPSFFQQPSQSFGNLGSSFSSFFQPVRNVASSFSNYFQPNQVSVSASTGFPDSIHLQHYTKIGDSIQNTDQNMLFALNNDTKEAARQASHAIGGDVLTPVDKVVSTVTNASYLWPGYPGSATIPYIIDDTLDYATSRIHKAMEQFHNHTCIRFVPRKKETNFLNMTLGTGCASFLGQLGGGQQTTIGLDCSYVGSIVHELGHVVGLIHEHQRPDRDQYLTIYMGNITDGNEVQFVKYNDTKEILFPEFDYNSIMIYGNHAFSKSPNKETMVAKTGVKLLEPYEKPGLDDIDIKQINYLYQCEAR